VQPCRPPAPADLLPTLALQISPVKAMNQALVATEVVFQGDTWHAQTEVLRHFAEHAAGIRCCGAAAVNLCHLAS
jgi:fructose-1,6-bisphosphatase/inositol monophosphatase family enzyme